MTSQTRTSIGFVLTGILGVLIGACGSGKLLSTASSQTNSVAAAASLRGVVNPDLEQRIITAVKQAEPSVVLIKSTVHGVQQYPFGNDPFFKQFFGQGQGAQPYTAHASGSGFIYKHD